MGNANADALDGSTAVRESCYADRSAVVTCTLYSICTAALLLLNKVIISYAPLPSMVSTLQFLATVLAALFAMVQGVAPVDRFLWERARHYLLYVAMFVTTIYCNFKVLEVSNVETLIVARSCVPCLVALLEYAFLGRQLPSCRSWLAMLVMCSGAVGYVMSDAGLEMAGLTAYTWITVYFLVVAVESAYGKHIVGPHLGFGSMWGPTLYTNTISIPPMVAIGLLSGEQEALLRHADCSVSSPVEDADSNQAVVLLVLISCALGVAVAFLGFEARRLVSATCFTVLGVAGKMATVTANGLIWDKHASPEGIAFLAACLAGAAIYQQSPLRSGAIQRRDDREMTMQPIRQPVSVRDEGASDSHSHQRV